MSKFGATDIVSNIVSLNDLDSIYGSVIGARMSQGLEVRGFGSSEVYETEVGLYGPTERGDLQIIIPALRIEKDQMKILDLGSGTGQLIMPLAILYPNVSSIAGIEYDQVLFDENRQALKIAEERELLRKGQVELHRGNFFDRCFEPVIAEADRVFYYLSSSNDEDRLADHLGAHLKKPSVSVIAYGDNSDPFPSLTKKWGFRKTTEGLLTTYLKVTDPTKSDIAA